MSQDAAARWDASVKKQQHRLRKRKFTDVKEKLDYDEFHQNLEQMQETSKNRMINRSLLALRPAFEQLNTFEKAVTSCVQAHAMPASLVWGVLQALLKCAYAVLETFDVISSLLVELTFELTRINKYVDLLPSNHRLQDLSCSIFDDYVDCCISAVKFFRRNPIVNLLKVFLSDPKKPLRSAQTRIRDNINRFDKEGRVDIDEKILQRLPGSIPEIGLFDVPLLKNEYFHGREAVLKDVHHKLSLGDNHTATRSCLIHAMGGMGKTQVALEYAYRYRRQYRCVFWLGAERVQELAVVYASIAVKLKMSEIDSIGQGRKIELVRKWFETTDLSWLLIFDNVETWESIRPFYPNTNGSVIVTSQIQGLSQVFRAGSIQLPPMATEEGAGLMLKHLHMEQDGLIPEELSRANETVERLGGMPIAIAHISGVMFDSSMTLSEALVGLETRQADLLWSATDPSTTQSYENKLNQVWKLALKELTTEALDLLYVLAMFNADKVQESMLIASDPLSSKTFEIAVSSFPNLIAKLARKQLVQRVTGSGTPYLTVHRSLQLNVRHTLSQNKTKRQEIFAQAVALLRKAFPAQHVTQTPSNESWSNYEEYQPHVLSLKAIFELTSPPLSAPPDFAMLLNDAANYFWELGFYRSSQEMASLAVSIFEKLPQPNLMDLASAYAIWGEAAAEEGIIGRDVWLRCSTKAIELRKEFLLSTPNRGTKDERLLFANSYNDFGAYLLHVGNYGQAEKYLDHALAIKALVATEDTESQMFAEGYQNLAVVYAARGDHAMAKKFITKAVELGTKANGPTAATTWTYNFDWANLALARDDYGGALSRHQQVLERRTGIFGEYNCRTRDSYHAVAVAYQGLGQYEEAEKMVTKSLDNLEESPWHASGEARAKYLLAQIYRQQHRYSQAEKLEEEADIIRRTILPEPSNWFMENPQDQMVLYDYMVCYRAGRASLGKACIKPFDPIAKQIDPMIMEPEAVDTFFNRQKAEGDLGKPDGSGH